jgi:hypothetical protein
MANEVQTLVLAVDATADDVVSFKCSDAGGAITVLEAYAVNHATTSGTATFTLALHKRTTAGTVIAGTVAAAIGGTADHWTDTLPKAFTIDSTYQVVDDGECLSVAQAAVDGGSPTRAKVVIHYVQGKA